MPVYNRIVYVHDKLGIHVCHFGLANEVGSEVSSPGLRDKRVSLVAGRVVMHRSCAGGEQPRSSFV
jgi:hypothetical protein